MISEDKKKRRKRKNGGWSWFERVHSNKIPQGDNTIPISTFNNSVDFGAITPDGGNLVGADGNGGMGVGEALDELNKYDD